MNYKKVLEGLICTGLTLVCACAIGLHAASKSRGLVEFDPELA